MQMSTSEIATATAGRLVGPDVVVDGVSFDSRAVGQNQLFVPIEADRDGHAFIDSARARGAAAYLTRLAPRGGSAVVVDDTLKGLMDLARWQRARFDGTVIGVTGSVGKTSTKDLAWAALAAGGHRTWANERSFNNDQGLPTTILNAPIETEVMVLEMGMRGFGEIQRLCGIAQPQIGIVTSVGEAHGDRVGGVDGVAVAKAELVRALPPTGVAILNGDDHRVRAMSDLGGATVVLYGSGDICDVRIVDLQLDHLARPSFRLTTPWGDVDVRLAISGSHMASNAAAALTCVGVTGGDLQAAADSLATVHLTSMRMEVSVTASGATIINDAYNANPTSMRAAIDALAAMPATRRIAVLGMMAEISDSANEHERIVRYAADRGVTVFAVDTDLYGMPGCQDAVQAVGLVASGDAVLVKASRSVGLERVAFELIASSGGLLVQ